MSQAYTHTLFGAAHHLDGEALRHATGRRDAEGHIDQRLVGEKLTAGYDKCAFGTEVANLAFRQHERVVVEHRLKRNREAACGATL